MYPKQRTQRVVVDGEMSDSSNVISGVPQGSVLGPTLFLFYINDMPEGVRSKIRLFADDTIMYLTITSTSLHSLQDDLDKLTKWESRWHMLFHPDKCEIMTITRRKKPILITYYLRGHALKRVSKAKYLGVTFNDNLAWSVHINNITGKANSTLGFLRRNLQVGSREIKTQAYQALVRPTLEYCSSVWDPHSKEAIYDIEMVQRRAARYVTGRYRRRSSVGEMLEELNWQTLEERRRTQRLSMMYKITHGLVAINPHEHMKSSLRASKRVNNSLSYQIPSARTDCYNFSFFPRTIRDWNTLPNNIATSQSIDSFKTAMANRAA